MVAHAETLGSPSTLILFDLSGFIRQIIRDLLLR